MKNKVIEIMAPKTEDEVGAVPYPVYKLEKEHQAKLNKIWLSVIILQTIVIIGLVIGFFAYKNQFEQGTETVEEEYYEYEVEQENESGNNNFIGRDGTIINGEAED